MPERQLWMSGPMTGGRNTRDARGNIAHNESSDDLNVEWTKYGSLTRRKGFRRIIPDEFTNGVRGLARYVNKVDGRFLLIQGDDKLISYKGDDYPYYDRQVLIDGLSVVERHFIQMNDWAYMSAFDEGGPMGILDDNTIGGIRPVRYNRRWVRHESYQQSKSDKEGVVRNMGLHPFSTAEMTPTPSTSGTGGLAFSIGGGVSEYWYRLSYQYYDLGESRYYMIGGDPQYGVAGTVGDDTVTIVLTDTSNILSWPGYDDAREVRVYRTLHVSTGATVDGPYYFVGTVQPGGTFVDAAADSALVDPAPLQPLFNSFTFPLFKLMAIHQNRAFLANSVEATDVGFEGAYVKKVEDFPYRLYYSDLYQPDRLMGFIDMPTRAPITGIISFYDQLVIFQQSTVLVLTGTGPSNFVLRTVDGSRGCIAPRSLDILENHVIFLSLDGYCAYNGATVKRISEGVRSDLDGLSPARQALACGAAYKGTYRGSIVREE